MRTQREIILLIAGGVVALIVIATIAALLSFDINKFKSQIESAAFKTTGLEVRINGKIGLSFSPFGLSAKDVHVADKGGEILSLEELKLRPELKPLLKKQFKVTSGVLFRPAFTIVKETDGRYNFEGPEKKMAKLLLKTLSGLNELKLTHGALVYFDRKTGNKSELKEFNLAIKYLLIGNTPVEIIKSSSLTGSIDCKEFLQKDLRIENLNASVKAVRGRYDFKPVAMGSLVYLDRKKGKRTEVKDIKLAIADISLADASVDIIKNVSFTGNLDCKEVLGKYLRIDYLKASVKATKGRYDFKPVGIGSLIYFNRKMGEKIEVKDINLAVEDLSLTDSPGELMKNVSFKGNVHCREVWRKDLRINNVKSSIRAEKAVFYFNPLTMDVFGAKGEGDATADESKVEAVHKINLKISKLDFEKLENSFGTKKMIGGKGDLFTSLVIKEKGNRNLLSSIDGSLSLRGDNLVIYVMDLDKVLSKYEKSQEFDLIDLGAFFIAGPIGIVAHKGYNYGDLYKQTLGGRGIITHFISHWKIKGGGASATDCAFATYHYRVALKGKLDLVREQYDNVTVALLDDKGCAKFKQSISGPFDDPQISTESTLKTLVGPIVNLFKKAERAIQDDKCEVFYNGSVQQPR